VDPEGFPVAAVIPPLAPDEATAELALEVPRDEEVDAELLVEVEPADETPDAELVEEVEPADETPDAELVEEPADETPDAELEDVALPIVLPVVKPAHGKSIFMQLLLVPKNWLIS